MIDPKKIRLMTKLAIYEKQEGEEDISIGKYYRADYVRMNILKTILAVTFGYLLLVLMIVIYHSEFLLDKALVLNYSLLGKKLLGYYLFLLVVYIGAVGVGYTVSYTRSRERLAKYYKMLGKLKKIEEQEIHRKELEEDRED